MTYVSFGYAKYIVPANIIAILETRIKATRFITANSKNGKKRMSK
jgi:hypothetical protein